jgi:hypothetical protein
MENQSSRPADRNRSSDMQALNPYEPPRSESRTDAGTNATSVGTITSRFQFTPEHLIETLDRFRSQRPGRGLWRWFRRFAATIFLLVAIAGLFVPQYWASAFMVAITIFMFFPHKIDDFLATRNFKKSPHCNAEQTLFLSEDGFRTESEIENTDVKWAAFAKALIFDDGVLLYRGTNMVNWIPDKTLDGDDAAFRLRKLLNAKLPTNQAVNRSRRQRVF